MQYLPWFYFGCSTHKGLNDFFSPKLFKPRRPFFYTSKYGTWRLFRKKIKFFSPQVFQIFDSKHGSPENYSDFFSSSSSSRSRAMRSAWHNSSKILSNWNVILQTCSGVNAVSCLRQFLGSFGPGGSESGDLKLEEFCHAIPGRISKYWDFLMNYILLCRNGSTRITNFILSWLEWQTRIVDPSCKINFLWRHRHEREAINPNSIL